MSPEEIAELYRIALTWTPDPDRVRMFVERYLQRRLQAEGMK